MATMHVTLPVHNVITKGRKHYFQVLHADRLWAFQIKRHKVVDPGEYIEFSWDPSEFKLSCSG